MGTCLSSGPRQSPSSQNAHSVFLQARQQQFQSRIFQNLPSDSSDEDDLDSEICCDVTDARNHDCDINPADYVYPFENIIFEGGGSKGLAYCGVIEVLEELGIWKQVKRLAGASAGAMSAALLAVGYNSREISDFFSEDLTGILLDHSCGYLSLLPNLLTGYGWNPGKKIFSWFGMRLQARSGNSEITFREVLDKFGKELCIVVTNLNQMCVEYCHVKTTPDMPIRIAVRMSMAIPGIFCASKYTRNNQTDTFVDGGVLCNYPIHCYDGWWLSMKSEDSFFKRLQPLEDLTRLFEKSERFGTYNPKTLGFLLYADNERDLLRYTIERNFGSSTPELPNTKLAKSKAKAREIKDRAMREHKVTVEAVSALLRVLKKHNIDEDTSTVSREELLNALEDTEDFPKKLKKRLFGKLSDEQILHYLDRDGNGQVSFCELLCFMEEAGIQVQSIFLGYERHEVNDLFTFLDTLQSTLVTNVKRIFVEEKDYERTVGINTGHVDTTDFDLEEEDREFIVQQGRKATINYLQHYVLRHNPPRKMPLDEVIPICVEGSFTSNHTTSTADDTIPFLLTSSRSSHGALVL